MTMRSVLLTLALIAAARVAAAQQPPLRFDDQPRSVTMSLAEYNRLLDLAARAPVAPVAAPVAAVVSSADMRITVDRETARGVFAIAGQVLHIGRQPRRLAQRRDGDRRQRRRPACAAGRRGPDLARAGSRARPVRALAGLGQRRWCSDPDAPRSRCRCRTPAPREPPSICRESRPTSGCRPG